MTKQRFFAWLLIAGLMLAACQQAPATTAGGDTPAATQADSTSNENSAVQPTVEPTTEPNVEPTEGSVSLPNIDTGLETLASFRSTFDAVVDTTKDGQPTTEKINWSEEFVREPASQHIVYTGSDADSDVEMVRIQDSLYVVSKGECQSMIGMDNPESLLGFSPASFLGAVTGQTFVGVETVNGASTRHFRGETNQLAFAAGYTNASADIWIAEQGGYTVKFTFSGEGSGSALFSGDENTTGTIRMEYNVFDVNQPITIAPPEGCNTTPGAGDVPILPDATDKIGFSGTTTYKTVTSLADAVTFYKTEMSAQGWTESPDSTVTDAFAQLTFTKEGLTVSITIADDPSTNERNVVISAQNE